MNPRPAALSNPWLVLVHLLPGAIATLVFILLVGSVRFRQIEAHLEQHALSREAHG